MHPLIALLCFLIFAAFVSLGDYSIALLGAIILFAVFVFMKYKPGARAWRMLRRMKIFFLSIFLLYTWFTPGKLLIPDFDTWSPTVEGVMYGGERVLALVILILAVDCFLSLLSREKILNALYYFFVPLHIVGFNRERFMLRTLLTLEAVGDNEFAAHVKKNSEIKSFSQYLNQLSQTFQSLIVNPLPVEEKKEIVIHVIEPPKQLQYLIPLIMLCLFLVVYTW